VAAGNEKIELSVAGLARVKATHERVQVAGGTRSNPPMASTTGFGELINVIIPPQFKTELQHNFLHSHAAGGGPAFPDEAARGDRHRPLNCFMKGHSGVGRGRSSCWRRC
jgi:histidine ammonia-lyase